MEWMRKVEVEWLVVDLTFLEQVIQIANGLL